MCGRALLRKRCGQFVIRSSTLQYFLQLSCCCVRKAGCGAASSLQRLCCLTVAHAQWSFAAPRASAAPLHCVRSRGGTLTCHALSAALPLLSCQVKEAHRRIMIANHPDAGGSSFIAAKVNEAKDMLLGKKTGGSSIF